MDDEEDLLELVNYNLTKEGYRVECVSSGEAALSAARQSLPDLIVLDLLLPWVDGLEICRLLKADSRTSHIPILMLTAKSEESDVVAGLELGADDYVTKPFSRGSAARADSLASAAFENQGRLRRAGHHSGSRAGDPFGPARGAAGGRSRSS